MKQEITLARTDVTVTVFIPDPASTDGSGKTGLVAANLTVSYVRVETDNDVTVTDVTSSLNNLAALTTAHTDWGLLEISSTLAPGLYRLDIADAVFAAGAWSAVVYVMITTSAAAASPMEFILVAYDPLDAAALGLTSLAAVKSLLDDARAEPGQGAPPVNPNMATKVDYLYKFLRNKITQTATEMKVFADDGSTVDHKSTVSDDATTFTRGEMATGP